MSLSLERLGFGRVLSRTIARVAAAFSARGYPHGTKLRTAHNFSIRNLRIVGLVNLTVLVLVLRYQLVPQYLYKLVSCKPRTLQLRARGASKGQTAKHIGPGAGYGHAGRRKRTAHDEVRDGFVTRGGGGGVPTSTATATKTTQWGAATCTTAVVGPRTAAAAAIPVRLVHKSRWLVASHDCVGARIRTLPRHYCHGTYDDTVRATLVSKNNIRQGHWQVCPKPVPGRCRARWWRSHQCQDCVPKNERKQIWCCCVV